MFVPPLSIDIIFAPLFATFHSAKQACLILLNVPFALVGGITALWFRSLNLNLSASIGFIALFGVSVLNGVVLVSYINSLRQHGFSSAEAVRQGAVDRLRPVLITALVASIGFLPMALSMETGDSAALSHRCHRRPHHVHVTHPLFAAGPLRRVQPQRSSACADDLDYCRHTPITPRLLPLVSGPPRVAAGLQLVKADLVSISFA